MLSVSYRINSGTWKGFTVWLLPSFPSIASHILVCQTKLQWFPQLSPSCHDSQPLQVLILSLTWLVSTCEHLLFLQDSVHYITSSGKPTCIVIARLHIVIFPRSVVHKLGFASESPGELVQTDYLAPPLEFLIQRVWEFEFHNRFAGYADVTGPQTTLKEPLV